MRAGKYFVHYSNVGIMVEKIIYYIKMRSKMLEINIDILFPGKKNPTFLAKLIQGLFALCFR